MSHTCAEHDMKHVGKTNVAEIYWCRTCGVLEEKYICISDIGMSRSIVFVPKMVEEKRE